MTDSSGMPDMFIYVAGPMQGYKDFNFPAFAAAARRLREAGYYVFSPAERDDDKYGADLCKSATGSMAEINAKGFSLREALQADTEWICKHATHIYMLRGWERSKGAFAEWALANALGIVIMYEE